MTDREFATDVVRRLQAAGFRALWAGGCVRDELLGLAPADYDVASDARPEQVKALFRRCVEVGASFGVIEVLGPRGDDGEWLKVQVATFRSDGAYTDGRRPDAVTFSTPEEDAARRDFTINGMFLDPTTGEIYDYVGGRADLAAKVLRAIGDPAARFAEDKLRVLRAVRMAARFGFTVDPATLAAAKTFAPQIRVVSAERIADELRKILAHPTRGRGVELLCDFELVSHVLPELASGGAGMGVVAALPAVAAFPLAFAALMHSAVAKRGAESVCRRLKFANDETERIAWLVEHHQALSDAAALPRSRLFPLLVHPGIDDLFVLQRAIADAGGWFDEHVHHAEDVLRTTPPEVLNPPPLLTGDDLIAAGWKPGKLFKIVLAAVRDAQLDGKIATPADALALANSLRGG